MFNIISNDIKKVFLLTFYYMIFSLVLAFIFKSPIFLCISIGATTSFFINLFLLLVTYEIVYCNKGVSYSVLRYILSCLIYSLVIYLVFNIWSNKYYVIITAMNFLSFKYILNIYHITKKNK